MTTVIISPVPNTQDEVRKLAKELLALTDQATAVEYVMWPEPGFRIPEELHAKFVHSRKGSDDDPDLVVEVTGAELVEETPEPVKRKPGRPKKVQGGQ